MRNTLVLLSSVALASVAGAQSTATATTTTDVTLGANANLQQIGLYQEAYHVLVDGSDGNFSEDLGGTATPGGSVSTAHSGDGATTFSATATATATLDSRDYSAVPHVFPNGGVSLVFQGYRFYVTLKNLTDVDQTVSFHVRLTQSHSGSAASPIGLVVGDPDGSYTPGAYADASFEGGVINRSTNDVNTFTNTRDGFVATTLFDGTASPTFGGSGLLGEFDATYTLPHRQIHTYQFYAASTVSAQFVPVPEPASMAALGIGALGHLRRSRKA